MEIAQLEGLRKQPRFFIEGVKNVPALSVEPPAYKAEPPEKFTRLE